MIVSVSRSGLMKTCKRCEKPLPGREGNGSPFCGKRCERAHAQFVASQEDVSRQLRSGWGTRLRAGKVAGN